VGIIRIRDDLKVCSRLVLFLLVEILEFNVSPWERRREALTPWEISCLPAAGI